MPIMTDISRPIRTAVLGLGRVGWGAHFERLARDRRFTVVAAADMIEENRKRAVERCGAKAFDDAGSLLNSLDELGIELVTNSLPSDQHVEPGLAALAAGRHVVIEKPVAPNVQGIKRLISASEESGKRLFVHHNRRFSPIACHLRKTLRSGRLGRVFQLSVNVAGSFSRRNDWQTLQRHNGGILRNHGTHWIDLALYALDEKVIEVWGDAKLICDAGDADDHTRVVFRTASGCVVDIFLSTSCKVPLPTLFACGTNGTLVTDCTRTSTLRIFDPKTLPPLEVDFRPPSGYGGAEIPLTEEETDLATVDTGGDYYDNVFEVLRRGGEPRVRLDQAVEVYRVIDAALASGVADWRG